MSQQQQLEGDGTAHAAISVHPISHDRFPETRRSSEAYQPIGVQPNEVVTYSAGQHASITEGAQGTTNGVEATTVPLTETRTNVTVEASTRQASLEQRHSPLQPLRQIWWPWIVAALAITSYVLTVCYAFGSTSLRYVSIAAQNPSNTLLVLRALSEATLLLILSLVYLCSDRALWMMIVRKNGVHIGSFLALGPGAGLWAWLHLIGGRLRSGRTLATIRIVGAITLPAMNIIILSRVTTQQRFDEQASFPIAGGVGDFDASFVDDYAIIAATYMSTDFSSLLQTLEVAWPVPVHQPGTVPVKALRFSPEGIVVKASVYTVRQLRGLQLDFTALEPGARFQGDTDCIVVGDKDSALQICISQFGPNSISAKYVHCPFTISGDCLDDRSWLSSSRWATQLTAYRGHATVHFSRSNLSAVAMADMIAPVPHDLDAADMLMAFNTSLRATTTLGSLVSAAGQFVSFVANSLALSETSSPTAAQSGKKLHNLLAMPLFYFQPTFMSPYTRFPSPDRVLDNLPTDKGLYTTASMSTVYFGLRIEVWTVWTYTAGMGLVLATCLVVLVLGSLPSCAGGLPDTTPWGFLDFVDRCYLDICGVELDEPATRTSCATGQKYDVLDRTASNDGWRHTGQSLKGAAVKLRRRS